MMATAMIINLSPEMMDIVMVTMVREISTMKLI